MRTFILSSIFLFLVMGSIVGAQQMISGDVNKFLKWITMLLYSGDHTVIITEDKNIINIKLVKINKGKK